MKTLVSDFPPANLDLGNAIPYLLASAGARLGNAFSKRLKSHGLNLSEWRVCASLRLQPHQTLSELAQHTSSDLSAMSRVVNRLLDMELVHRRRNESDGRAVRIELSLAGHTLTQTLTPLAKQYEKIALAGFTAAEVNLLRDFLIRVHSNAGPLG